MTHARFLRSAVVVAAMVALVLPTACSLRRTAARQRAARPAIQATDAKPADSTRSADAAGSPASAEGAAPVDATTLARLRATGPASITADSYRAHIAILAADALEGRGTGQPGIDLAAGYIAGQFAAAGIQPGGPDGSYFQLFEVKRGGKLTDEVSLVVRGVEGDVQVLEDYIPFSFSEQGKFSGDVAFVGYGISNPDKNHDDYANLDVTGKVVLMLRREPASMMENEESSRHAMFETKVTLAKEKGAAAVMIVNQKPDEGEADNLMVFRGSGDTYGLPALHVTRDLADRMLAAGGAADLATQQAKLDAGEGPVSTLLTNVGLEGNVAYEVDVDPARNVVGLIPGTGPNKDEYVVIGGHYDHLGNRGGTIYNGADDNASGTAGMMEVCEALVDTPNLNRSVICMAFSGEEIGLLGSRHYAEHPTVSISSITAMINMDMIGRYADGSEDNGLSVQGLGTGDNFKDIVERRTAEHGFTYTGDDSALGPSDHMSFYQANVPSLFFFTGVHPDYHQPGDDVDKVNFDGGAAVARLVYDVALDLVNAPAAPQFVRVDRPAEIDRSAAFGGRAGRGGGVVMGIMPDMDDTGGRGWKVAEVFPGGGAAKAGMQNGDRILEIEGIEITGLEDYREVTREKKPGDVITVKVLRGADEVTLSVELAGRDGQGQGRGRRSQRG